MRRLVLVALGLAGLAVVAGVGRGGASRDWRSSPLAKARGLEPATISMFQGRIKPVPELVERARLNELTSVTPNDPRDIDDLETQIGPIRNPASRTPAGLWRISLSYPAVRWMSDGDFAYADRKFAAWKALGTSSVAPVVYRALILEAYVDRVFMSALPDADPEKLASEFRRRADLLERFLEENKAIGSADPVWYEVALRASSYDCANHARADQLLDEASRRFPGYPQHYQAAIGAALRCVEDGDDISLVIARIADLAVERSKATDGQSMFARAYWAASGMLGTRDLKRVNIDWERMRIAIRDLLQRYPDAWNTNHMAAFACEAKDDVLARELLPKVLEHPVVQVWQPEEEFTSCWSRVNAVAKK